MLAFEFTWKYSVQGGAVPGSGSFQNHLTIFCNIAFDSLWYVGTMNALWSKCLQQSHHVVALGFMRFKNPQYSQKSHIRACLFLYSRKHWYTYVDSWYTKSEFKNWIELKQWNKTFCSRKIKNTLSCRRLYWCTKFLMNIRNRRILIWFNN